MNEKERKRREDAVLAVMNGSYTPAGVARLLNLRGRWPKVRHARCDWCPVLPARSQLCATVPASSRERVHRVLKSLVRRGKVTRLDCDGCVYCPTEILDKINEHFRQASERLECIERLAAKPGVHP